jgi:hypothetical protein
MATVINVYKRMRICRRKSSFVTFKCCIIYLFELYTEILVRVSSVGITTELRTVRSGGRTPVGARYSAPVKTGPRAHQACYTMGTGSFPGGKAAGAWR